MRKLLVFAILTSSLTFAQGVKETLKESKKQLEKTKEIVKDGTETVSKAKSSALNVYGDLKDGTALVYDDFKTLGNEAKGAMSEIVKSVKNISLKTWDLLVKQQKVWSFMYLALTLSSIFLWYKFNTFFKKMQTELTELNEYKLSNVLLTFCFFIFAVASSVHSVSNMEQMLTGFINPEFGALRNVIELAKTTVIK